MPTYSPHVEADMSEVRPYERLTQEQIADRIASGSGRKKPWLYMDAADSVMNVRPDIKLVVADGRSTESMRTHMRKHHAASADAYNLVFYQEKMSQWIIFNDVMEKFCGPETKYFIYTSSDVIWQMDWVAEAIKEFEKNPKYHILFPCVNRGDPNLPCQVAPGPRDLDPVLPPYQEVGKAPVLNAYAIIFRMDFLRTYGGYPTLFRNCFTESFLAYMCQAAGGEMRLLPRGWCYHYGTMDLWSTPAGSCYHYTEEKMLFQDIMNQVLMRKAMGVMTVEYLKNTLYKKD